MPSGRLFGSHASAAIRRNGTVRSVPAIEKTPSAKSRSASAASSRCAAIAFRLLDDPVGRHQHRRAAQRRRARAAGALAERDLVGIALDVGHLVRMNAEPVAHQLLVDRLVPHALRDRAGQQRRGAAAVEADLGRLEAARRGALDRVRKAEAAQPPAGAGLGAPRLEPSKISEFKRDIHVLLELAAIVGEDQPGLERHRLGRDRVAPAQFDRIDAESRRPPRPPCAR